MKIFLSQTMNGRTDEEIMKERALAKSMLIIKYPDAEFIDSFIANCENHKNIAVWCLGRSLELLADADLCVYISESGYALPRGCRIEEEVCLRYNIPYVRLMVKSPTWAEADIVDEDNVVSEEA